MKLKYKSISIMIIFIFIVQCFTLKSSAASYGSDYRYWSQGSSDYSLVRSYGCWVVAQAKLLYESGIDRSASFNPDSYAVWEVNNGHLRNLTNDLNQINGGEAPSNYASQKGSKLEYLGNWTASADQLWYNIRAGYYTIVKVNNGGHYVYLDNQKSLETNQLYCDDSSTDNYYRGPRLLSSYGTWNSGYVYRLAHSHSYSSSITKNPTCTEKGVKTFKCSCGNSYTEEIAATGHKYSNTVHKPTITEQGYTVHVCSVCGNSYTDGYVNPPKLEDDGWYYAD